MDAGTIAAVAALVVAFLAFIVASAQVAQQYLVTGSLIRLCDSTVYGSLPGRGKRVWNARQFRFRVVYALPQIRLRPNFWPEERQSRNREEVYRFPCLHQGRPRTWSRPTYVTRITSSFGTFKKIACPIFTKFKYLRWMPGKISLATRQIRRTVTELIRKVFFLGAADRKQRLKGTSTTSSRIPSLYGEKRVEKSVTRLMRERYMDDGQLRKLFEPDGNNCGEASWASFAKAVEYSCSSTLCFQIIQGDADRCPADLTVVPMQVSLRDVIVMGLMSGMEISQLSCKQGGLSMWGPSGSITSSKHSVLGNLIHFVPSNSDSFPGFRINQGQINKPWVSRIGGFASVAGRSYSPRQRKLFDSQDGDWEHLDSRGNGRFGNLRMDNRAMGLPRKSPNQAPDLFPDEAPNRSRKSKGYAFLGANLTSPTERLEDLQTVASDSYRSNQAGRKGHHDGKWFLLHQQPGPTVEGDEWITIFDEVVCRSNSQNHKRLSHLGRLKTWIIGRFGQGPNFGVTPVSDSIKEVNGGCEAIRHDTVLENTNNTTDHVGPPSNSPSHPSASSSHSLGYQHRNATNSAGSGPESAPGTTSRSASQHAARNDSESGTTSPTSSTHGARQHLSDGLDEDSTSIVNNEPQVDNPVATQSADGRDFPIKNVEVGITLNPNPSVRSYQAFVSEDVDSVASEKVPNSNASSSNMPSETPTTIDHRQQPQHRNPRQLSVSSSEEMNQIIIESIHESDTSSTQSADEEEPAKGHQPETVSNERWRNAQRQTHNRRKNASVERRDHTILNANQRALALLGNRDLRGPPVYVVQHPDDPPEDPAEINEAERRQEQRDRQRAERDRSRRERKLQRKLRNNSSRRPVLDYRWMSQLDIIPGYCANPWKWDFPIHSSIGMISVILEALLGFVDRDSLVYVIEPGEWKAIRAWLRKGKHTWPAYARNAQGGVVVGRSYVSAKFPGFASPTPRLELWENHYSQSRPEPLMGKYAEADRLAELAMLDAWLSICGRTPEIDHGRSALLENMPSLAQVLLEELEDDFEAIDLSANDGGHQLIKEIAQNLMDYLTDDQLSEAEQVYALVALLRTAKMALCIGLGPDTWEVAAQGAFETDVKVWLV